jgi:tryptophan synthase beta chain
MPESHAIKEQTMRKGYFGAFGGQFVPELLIPPLRELEEACAGLLPARDFQEELGGLLRDFAGRPTPLALCGTLSLELGFSLWIKREDLLHTGAHKMNNTLGQALLARRMGKSRLIAETGAGQHGVATAAAAARLGLGCAIYMGAEDVERQSSNVERMKFLGAEVIAVRGGSRTLKDAINEALRAWIAEQADTHYCFGTAAGPHPFPTLVRDLQAVIGVEAKAQIRERIGRLPDAVIACVGGGSNAIGIFHPFAADPQADQVRLIGIEAGGSGEPGCANSAPISLGRPGVLHGQYSMLLQDPYGQVLPSQSVSAGLDYPGVGPEHAHLASKGRAEYKIVYDEAAVRAYLRLSEKEGIIPALESSHALAWVLDNRRDFARGAQVIVNLSGRGDKDMGIVARHMRAKGGAA